METAPNQASSRARFWRRLVSAAAIYALVIQPLLLAVVGAQLAQASAVDDLSLAQLCVHQTDGGPTAPADGQTHPANDHCLLCFAGAFHLLDAPEPTVSHADPASSKVRPSARQPRLTSSSRYSIARPRGPPISA
jgi:hypothetical protein